MRKPYRISPVSLFETSLWPAGRRRTDYEAYHDLMRRANLYPSTVRIRGKEVTLQPHQVLCSTTRLADDWDWSRSGVWDFFQRLLADRLATVDTTHKTTILTLYPDRDAPTENKSLDVPAEARKYSRAGQSAARSTGRPPEHSISKEDYLNSLLSKDSNTKLIESAAPFAGEDFTRFLMDCLSGPRRLKLGPDIMVRVREAYLDKLISEGRLNPAEKDRILLSSNGVQR